MAPDRHRSIDQLETEIALVRVDLGLTLDALAVSSPIISSQRQRP